jgi:hypothetical protein
MHTIVEVAVGLVAAGNHVDAAVVEDYSVAEASRIVIAEATV